jgi:hypothetical protein
VIVSIHQPRYAIVASDILVEMKSFLPNGAHQNLLPTLTLIEDHETESNHDGGRLEIKVVQQRKRKHFEPASPVLKITIKKLNELFRKRCSRSPNCSGVSEVICKTITKQYFYLFGMRWKEKGAVIILCLRKLVHLTGWLEKFWKVNQYGFSISV